MENNNQALIDFAREHLTGSIQTIKFEKADELKGIIAVPKGYDVYNYDALLAPWMATPRFHSGTSSHTSIDNFIEYIGRFATTESAVFAFVQDKIGGEVSFTAVMDYGTREKPGFRRHRAVLEPQISPQMAAWLANSGKHMEQKTFAEFIEDRVDEIMPGNFSHTGRIADIANLLNYTLGGPQDLLQASQGLIVNVNKKVGQAVRLATGETQVVFQEDHTSTAGAKPENTIKVPGMFAINVPFWRSSKVAYVIGAKLRYKVVQDKVVWFYELIRPDLVVEDAATDVANMIRAVKIGSEDGPSIAVYNGMPDGVSGVSGLTRAFDSDFDEVANQKGIAVAQKPYKPKQY
jgi:uncharacterized protein YfdQ (DUF2303 family)